MIFKIVKMKQIIPIKTEVEIKYLLAIVEPRYWDEDFELDGSPFDGEGYFPGKIGDEWKILIDIDTGKIINWELGHTAQVYSKICDAGEYKLLGPDQMICYFYKDDMYVPSCLYPKENGYGDYIIMDIDENGVIKDWKFDISDFFPDEDEK